MLTLSKATDMNQLAEEGQAFSFSMGSLLISIDESMEFLTIALVSKGEESFEDMTLVLILSPIFSFLKTIPSQSWTPASLPASTRWLASLSR